ncbi:MAG: ABC transporter substrate-binding protein [Desulfomonilaceae bacterium]
MKKLLGLAAVFVLSVGWMTTSALGVEPIVIGVPTSLTSIEGRESLKSVQMAVEEINAKGGVKVGNTKRPLKVETIDLRDFSPGVPVTDALLGIEKIITEKKPAALVVGPFRSEAMLAGMDIVSKYKVPLLETIAMSPKSGEMVRQEPEKYKYIFRVSFNAKYMVQYVASTLGFLKDQFGFTKVFSMYQDVLWARASAEHTVKAAAAKFGWQQLGADVYPTGSSDFAAGLSKARTKGAQVILVYFDMPQGGILVKQAIAMKIPALVAGSMAPMCGTETWKTFDGKIGGLINVVYELGSSIATDKYPPSKKFYDAYKKKYGVTIQACHGPAPSYDSVYILAEAIERAKSLDPDKLVTEIKKTDRSGVIGRIKFDDGNQVIYGDDPTKTAVGCVFQWADKGKRVIVFPKPIAEGPIKLPPWLKAAK